MQSARGNLLIVDDQPDALRLLASLLSERGYLVRPARDGAAAVAAARAAPPDLILLDIQMPQLDGYATCQLLKAHPATAAIPVMFISAHNEVFDKVRAFAAGGVDYISKPYEAAEVLARVETQLRLATMQRHLEAQNRLLQQEVAERRQVEAELQHHQDRLEELVAARTAALTTALARLEQAMAERTRAEEALYLTRFTVERVADALYWMDSEGRFVDVNTAACEMLGYSRDELLTMSVFDIDPGLSRERWRQSQPRLKTNGALTLETTHQTRAGAIIPVELVTNYIAYRGRELDCAIVRDISERKRAEAARRAQEQAEAANQAKSAFLAHISHELRTPLNGILGYAHLLTAQPLSQSLRDGLSAIQYSGEHLLTLINDILDLAKIEAGKIELTPSEVQLADFLERVVGMVRSRAEAKRLSLRVALPPTLPCIVRVDEKCLRQVLLNLLGNAVKFTDQGQVSLALETIEQVTPIEAQPQAGLRFTVADTGVGIAPDQLKRIFEPFVQVGAVERRSGGTGLGLAISRQLIALLGGQLLVQSQPGQGSAFWFELLLPIGADPARASPVEPARSSGRADMALPPRAELERIYRQAQAGNLLGVYAQVRGLAEREPRYQPFATQISELALAAEYEAICAWLSSYLSSSP